MTYCSKKDCKLGVACVRHILRIKEFETNPYLEDLSNDKDFCVIKYCQEKQCNEAK